MFEWCRGHVWNVCFRIVPSFKNNVAEYISDLTESDWLWSQIWSLTSYNPKTSICRGPKKSPDICIKMRRWYSKITRYIIPNSFSKLPPTYLKKSFSTWRWVRVYGCWWEYPNTPTFSHLPTCSHPPAKLLSQQLPPTSNGKKSCLMGVQFRKVKIDVLEKMFGKTFCLMYTGNESLYIPAINATNAALVVRNPLQCAATWGRSQKWRRKLLKGGLDASCSGGALL